MTPILYYYEHCPYCVRVLCVLQMAKIPFEGIILLNDDERTPIDMIGQKQLPILQIGDNTYIPESLDIIHYLCQTYQFQLLDNRDWEARVDALLLAIREVNYGLTMPRWVKSPFKEFATAAARDYFINKKTATIGDFDLAIAKTSEFAAVLSHELQQQEELFETLSTSPQSKASILLFSGLYGIHCVKDFSWPEAAKAFMQMMAEKTELPL